MLSLNGTFRRPIFATVAMAVFAVGHYAGAQTTGTDLLNMCRNSAALVGPAVTEHFGQPSTTMILAARVGCQEAIVNTWNAMLQAGDRLCPEGTITADQLEMVFVAWAQHHPAQIGISSTEAVTRAYRSAFPCR